MEEFVNRKDETQRLEHIINSNSQVGVIFSHEGIGKSCFIEHFIHEFREADTIIIKNEELDFGDNVEKYYFADKICESILKNSDGNIVLKLFNQLSDLKIKPSVSLSYGWISLNFEINKKFRLLQDLIAKLLKDRVRKLIIYIDNINKIDYQSLIFISQIIEQNPNVFFILEFKLEKEEKFPIKLAEFFKKQQIIYNYIELKKLSCEHAYKVMQNNNIDNLNDIINEYDTFNGNLKELILMNVNNIKQHWDLDENEYFILKFIDLAKGELSNNEIYEIIHKFPGSNSYLLPSHTVNEYIHEMQTQGLINFNSANKLYITSLGKKCVRPYKEYLITEMLANYYIPIIINDKSELCLKGLKILLPLLTQNADIRIKKILPSLHKNVVISRCNKEIIDEIYNNIDLSTDNDDVRVELIKAYISFGDYKTALNKIQFLMHKPNDTITILYATLISHMYSADIAEAKVIDLLSKVTKTESKSAIFTCVVALYMKIKHSSDVLDYVRNLELNNEMTETDRNIINKNISIYYDFNKANIVLNNCLSYFETHNMNKLSIATRITLATRLAQKGHTQDASNKLKEILDIDYISELDYIYTVNNMAAIKMLEGDFSNIKEKDLINNYKYIQDEYSKLLAANNLLVYYCNINNYNKAKEYADILELIGNTKYKFESYLLLTFLNLKYYYQKVNANKIQTFNNELQRLLNDCNDGNTKAYIKCMIDDTELPFENDLYFLSRFKYRPAFLGHWIINDFDY